MSDQDHPLTQRRAGAALALAGISATGWGFIATQLIAPGILLSALGAAGTVWLYWADFSAAFLAVRALDGAKLFGSASKELWTAVGLLLLNLVMSVWLTAQPSLALSGGGWVSLYFSVVLLSAAILGFLFGYRERSGTNASAEPRIYVTQITIDPAKLMGSKPAVEIAIVAVNGTSRRFDVVAASGFVSYREVPSNQLDEGVLAPPQLRSEIKHISHGAEFMVILELPMSRRVAEGMQRALADGHQLQFRLHDLAINLAIDGLGQARLPLWAGLTLNKSSEHVWTGKIVELNADPLVLSKVSIH